MEFATKNKQFPLFDGVVNFSARQQNYFKRDLKTRLRKGGLKCSKVKGG